MNDAVIRFGYSDADLQSGLAKSSAHLSRFAAETKRTFAGVAASTRTAFANGLGMVGGFIGIAGIRKIIEDGDRIGDIAKQLDVSAESVQRLGLMAKLSGSDMESVAAALNRVNRELAEGEGFDVFEDLDIDVKRYLALDADQQIIMLARAFQAARVNGKGLAEAYELFGKSAAELLPLMKENVDQLEAASKVDVVSNEQIEQMQKMNDEFDKLSQKADTFFKKSVTGWAEMLKYAKDYLIGGFDKDGNALLPGEFADKKLMERADAAGGPSGTKDPIEPKEDPRAKREAELAEKRAESAKELEEDMHVLELRAHHHKKAADNLEREVKIRREALKIARDTGMSEDDALKTAKKKADLEDKAKGGHGGHVKGYSQKQRAENKYLHRSSLDDWYSETQNPFWVKHGGHFKGLDAVRAGRHAPINQHPVKHEASTHAKAITDRRNRANQTIEQKLDKLVENTDPLKDL